MVSYSGSIFNALVKFGFKITGTKKNMDSYMMKNRDKASKFKVKKGYKVTFKETEKKTRYLIFQKDTNEPIKRILYYIHGGAYVMGLHSIYYNLTYNFCNIKDDLAVVLLDYSLAPEHIHPTQINEAMDVWKELITEYKPENIIVGGDSAGGNCAMVLVQQIASQKMVLPKAAIFISPVTDYSNSFESHFKNYQKDILFGNPNEPLTKEFHEEMLKKGLNSYYVGDMPIEDRKNPLISPAFGDFTIFPKSLFFVGSDEMLLDDTLNVVEKIKKENKDTEVECIVKEGMIHCYPIYTTMMSEGKQAQEKIKSYILENLY